MNVDENETVIMVELVYLHDFEIKSGFFVLAGLLSHVGRHLIFGRRCITE